MIRHHTLRRIAAERIWRYRPLTNRSHASQQQSQTLHKGLEQLQTPAPAVATAQSNAAADSMIAKQKSDRLSQAMINGVCSFLVVLLAAQSYKAAGERRKALDHLDAATSVLKDKQTKLKELVEPATADDLAAACMETLRENKQRPKSSWRNLVGLKPDDGKEPNLEQQISATIHARLRSLIDPTDLDADSRDKELVRELVKTVEPPKRKQVFTI